MTLSSSVPLNKVTFSTAASAVVALILWALQKYAGLDASDLAVIGPVAMILVTFLAGYFTPLSDKEATQIVNAPDAPEQVKE